MEVLIKPLSGCEYEIEMIVPPAELQPHFDKAYSKVRSDLTMPGFRKGHVPLAMVKQRFGKAIEADSIEELSNDFFKKAMEERDIKPVGQPHIHNLDYKRGEPLTIKIHYEVMPEVEAHDYKGIEVEKMIHEVKEEDVDNEIEYLRQRERTLEEAEKAEDEDYLVTIDLQMLDQSGVPLIGKKNDDIKIALNDELANRDLKAELLNMKMGEEKNVELTYEGKDGVEEHDNVRVHVKKIEKIILPETNDEFAKKVSNAKHETMESLRNSIEESLVKIHDVQSKNAVEGQIVNEIVKRNPIDVPPSVVEKILESYIEQLKDQNQKKSLPPDFNAEEFKKARRADAIWQAKWIFIRESIIKQENLVVEDIDVEERAEQDALKTGIAKERMIQFLKQSHESADSILGEKVMKLLVENSIIKEVNDDHVDEELITSIEG